MKHLFRLLLTLLTLTAVLVSCDKKVEEKDVILVPGKTTVIADGADKVTFTVRYGEQDVTSSAEISVDGAKLSSAEFTATDAGEYKFKATYDGKTSNEVTVTATEAPAAALILSVDKNSIIADNTDKAVFTVMQNGVDVTGNSNICMPSGVCLLEPVYTSAEVGEYIFYATVKDSDGTNKSNEVTVTVTEVPEAEFDATKALHKNVAFFTYTATWCGPCHDFKTYMKNVVKTYGDDNIVQVNYYTPDSNDKVASRLSSTIRSQLIAAGFNFGGVPTLIAELTEQFQNLERNLRNTYNKYVEKQAMVGIKVNSAVTYSAIDLTVTVGAQQAGTYYIGSFLVEDNIQAPQTGSTGSYNHTNVLRAKGESNIFGTELGTMAVGETMSKNYSFPMDANYTAENLHIVVYVLYEQDGKKIIANSVKASANGLTNYKYVD